MTNKITEKKSATKLENYRDYAAVCYPATKY